jgi:hypothetical protein
VVKSLALQAWRPVGLVYPQNFGNKSEKPTCVSCLTLGSRFELATEVAVSSSMGQPPTTA